MRFIAYILALALGVSFYWLAGPVATIAQNLTCPTAPTTDSSNRCASTAFVKNAISTPPLTLNHIFIGNASTLATDVPMTGDAGVVYDGSSAAITVSKTNGIAFARSATVDTTNAANISSGTLPSARIPSPTSSAFGGLFSSTNTANNFVTNIDTNGVQQKAQPSCSTLSNGSASCSTDTTNASNISSGTLATARLPNPWNALSSGTQSGLVYFSTTTQVGSSGALNTDQVLMGQTASVPTPTSVPNCTGALNYSTSTHSWSCNTSAGTGTVTNIATSNGVKGGPITTTGTIQADVATPGDIYTATPFKMLDAATTFSAGAPVTIAYSSTLTVDFSTGINFTVTLGGNPALSSPTNVKPGQTGCIFLAQDATGSRSIASYGSNWKFAGGATPTLTSTANAVDALCYLAKATNFVIGTMGKNYQ